MSLIGAYFYILYIQNGRTICMLVVVVVRVAVNTGECCEGTWRLFRVLNSIAVKYN